MTSGFSVLHIAVTAVIAGVTAAALGTLLRIRRAPWLAATVLTVAATMLWRLAANVAALNDDGIPWVSANDVLAPLVVYLVLGMYADLAAIDDRRRFEVLRVAITAAALVVNVIAI